jgi:hypothetical protein
LAGTRFALDGNNPTTIPGDFLKVNIGGVTDSVHTPGVPGAGLYTSSDHAEIAYVEIEETQTIVPVTLPANNLDNVYVVQINEAQSTLEVFDANPPFGRPIYSAPLAHIAGLSLDCWKCCTWRWGAAIIASLWPAARRGWMRSPRGAIWRSSFAAEPSC